MTIESMQLVRLSDTPLVSVIISNYNYGRFLSACVESLTRQTWDNIEIVICDDGSTDESPELLDQLSNNVPNLTVISKTNGGQASAWNVAVAYASGDILAFLDPDDEFIATKIERVVAAFAERPYAGICVHQLIPRRLDSDDIETPFPVNIDDGWIAEQNLRQGGWGQWPPSSGISIRREIADLVFPVPEVHRLGWGDAYVLAIGQFLTPFVAIDEPLTRYLIHGSNSVSASSVSVKSVENLIGGYELLFHQTKTWVHRRFGDDVADQLNILDNRHYVEHLLALRLLADVEPERLRRYSTETLIAQLPESRRNLIWTNLFRMPRGMAQRALGAWWSVAPWKKWARRVSGIAGIRPGNRSTGAGK